MKFERVNLRVILVDLSDDWPSSSTFVTFMGPCLAVYRVDENDMDCSRAKHAAKNLEQALEHEAIPMIRPTRDYFGFNKRGAVEAKVDHIECTRGTCSISKMLPVAEPFTNCSNTSRSPREFEDRNTLRRALTYDGSESIRTSIKVTPSQIDLMLRLLPERQQVETP